MIFLFRSLFLLSFFLYTTIVFPDDLFSMTESHEPSHNKTEKQTVAVKPHTPSDNKSEKQTVSHGDQGGQDNLSVIIPEELLKTFQLIIDAKSPENLKSAILKTTQLAKQKGKVGETAAFLLGDLYQKQWEQGDQKAMDQAMLAYGRAIRNYTISENTNKALIKKGNIYFHNKLYPEALGNYQRVVSQGDNRYAISAHMKMAQSFQKWERWSDALQVVSKSALLPLSQEDRDVMASIQAESLYQLGRFEESYQAYHKLFSNDRYPHAVNPSALAVYGEVAYRTSHYRGAEDKVKSLLKRSYEADSKDPISPLALARLGFMFKLEGDAVQAETAANLVYAMMADIPNVKAGKIIVATANLAVLNCPNPCTSGLAEINLKQLEKVTKSLLLDVPFTIAAQGAILDGLAQMQRYQRYDVAEELYTLMIDALPSSTFSPYIFYAKNKLRQLVFEHFDHLSNAKQIASLYRRFWRTFAERITGEAGLKVAKSYLKLGDLSTALNLLGPIAQNKQSPASEEALHQWGLLLARLGKYREAEHALVEYRVRYPEKHAVLVALGDVYANQGLLEPATVAYEEWLRFHPNGGITLTGTGRSVNRTRDQVYEKLTVAYRSRQDLQNQTRVYEAWIKEIPSEPKRPYMLLADIYYQQQRYKDAIRYFELALKFEKKPKEIDWALLRLATSYINDKQQAKGKAILQKIPKQAKDRLIKQIAMEKNLDFSATVAIKK